MIFAVTPLLNSWRSLISGFKSRCRSAASTSQSAMTLFFDKTASDAVNTVFPVPPFPLMITICFILISLRAIQRSHLLSGENRGHMALYQARESLPERQCLL